MVTHFSRDISITDTGAALGRDARERSGNGRVEAHGLVQARQHVRQAADRREVHVLLGLEGGAHLVGEDLELVRVRQQQVRHARERRGRRFGAGDREAAQVGLHLLQAHVLVACSMLVMLGLLRFFMAPCR